jgi:hypothetical protein
MHSGLIFALVPWFGQLFIPDIFVSMEMYIVTMVAACPSHNKHGKVCLIGI